MSLQQRTPPSNILISGSESVSGSVPNLSAYDDEDSYINVNPRKRKERTEIFNYQKDQQNFHREIMSLLEKFGQTQNENLIMIKEEIHTIKNEIKIIQSSNENLIQQLNQINLEIEKIKLNYTGAQNKIKAVEDEITIIKNQKCTCFLKPNSLPLVNENLILEVKDRFEREKNVIIVGISEKNDNNYKNRRQHDENKIMELISPLYVNCPKPIKTMRLGKYIPNKSRPIKVFFNNTDISKYLLSNKHKLPETVKIFSDQTPMQKLFMQELKDELQKRTANGEKDLIIKYIKGTPTIITNKTNKKN
ncbi:unnamed protein product [Euphydryas editha]|uniref:Uncharacterized protein n=1 Tax=Euphydryas editha TaxID=104508 RepID=A0AAU9VF48_EUPED|nr:unnamed protein product [Euphydryas editha]